MLFGFYHIMPNRSRCLSCMDIFRQPKPGHRKWYGLNFSRILRFFAYPFLFFRHIADPNDPTFFGNGSDYFKILTIDDNSVLIGAKNNVYNLSLTRLNENRDNRIEWTSSEAHREMCVLKGKNNSDCQNYIRIYARVADQQVMLCGTNSFKPMCRYYKLNAITSDGSLFEMKQEFEGEG
jgi:Sema domain